MSNEIKNTPLFHTIKTIIDADDPEGRLSTGAPENEYDNESAKIAELLRPDMNEMQILAVIRDVMTEAFRTCRDENGNKVILPRYGDLKFLPIASKIYECLGDLIVISSGRPKFVETAKSTAPDYQMLPDADWCFDMTPEELIDSMFECTAKDGTFYGFTPFNDITLDMEAAVYKLYWTKIGRDRIKAEFAELYAAIRKKAAGEEIPSTIEYMYLQPIEPYERLAHCGRIKKAETEDHSCYDEKIAAIIDKKRSGETCSHDERMAYEYYLYALEDTARDRVGFGYHAYELIQYARRLCELIKRGAPKMMIDNEANGLASCMVYHSFANDKEDLPSRTPKELSLQYLEGSFEWLEDEDYYD